MKNIFGGIAVAFSMYSRIPMPHWEWTEESMRYSMCFFPAIGIVTGCLELLWLLVASLTGIGVLFTAAVAIILPVLVSGGIHLDGFLDTSDALSSWRTREERLRILKDPHAGAFAVISGIVLFVVLFGAAGELAGSMISGGKDHRDITAILPAFVMARGFSALSVVTFPGANPKGTVAAFSGASAKKAVVLSSLIYIVGSAGLSVFLDPLTGVLLTGVCLVIFGLYRHTAMKYFGGTTGDLCGWFVTLAETAMLLAGVLGSLIERNLL